MGLTSIPLEARFVPEPVWLGLELRVPEVPAVDADVVPQAGTCPQAVPRLGSGSVLGPLAPDAATPVVPPELVNGGTVNGWAADVLVDGRVLPFTAPRAEATGSIVRPARSTFCASVCADSESDGGTEGKLNPDGGGLVF